MNSVTFAVGPLQPPSHAHILVAVISEVQLNLRRPSSPIHNLHHHQAAVRGKFSALLSLLRAGEQLSQAPLWLWDQLGIARAY